MTNITPPSATAAKPTDKAPSATFITDTPDTAPFVTAASQAPPVHPRKMAGKQAQISLALPPKLLDKVDHMAESLSISRAAFIKQALSRAVNS